MNRVQEVLASHALAGVEYVRLGELIRIKNGRDYKHLDSGHVPVYGTGGVMTYVDTAAHPGPSVLIPRKGSLNKLYFVDGPFWTVDTIFYSEVGSRLLPKFLYYYLLTQRLEELNKAGGVPSLTQGELNQLKVPVPPLELQREIVRILDNFTELEAQLEAELQARRLQYVHYRDQLVVSGLMSERRSTLGELAAVARGASPRPIQAFLTDDPLGVPWIKIGDVPVGGKFITSTAQRVTEAGAAKSRRVHPGDFVLSNSMSFGRPYISKIEGCIHDGWLAISEFGENFLPDYLYHLLSSTPVQQDFARRVGSSTVSNLNSETVKATVLPVPSLAEQARVIEVLDKFDALVNDLSIGLPAELVARRKQYEFYRDKLLTFEEAPA